MEFPLQNCENLQKVAFPGCRHQPVWLCPPAANGLKYNAKKTDPEQHAPGFNKGGRERDLWGEA